MTLFKLIPGALGVAASALLWPASLFSQINSPKAPGYIDRGSAMLSTINARGAYDQASGSLRLTSDPDNIESSRLLEALASALEDSQEAPQLLKSWLKNYPMSQYRAEVQLTLGDWYFAHELYGEALKQYNLVGDNALNTVSSQYLAYRKAYCMLLLSENEGASAIFTRLAATPGSTYATAARFYNGYIAYRKGDLTKAAELFKACSSDPDLSSAADCYLCQIYYKQGNYNKALTSAKRALKSGYSNFYPEANRVAGESLYNLGRSSEAVPMLWKYAEAVESPAPTALYILATDEYLKGNYTDAANLLQRVVKSSEATGAMAQSAWLYLGQCYVKGGQTNQAVMAFENAFQLNADPTISETAFYNYAVAMMDGGKTPFGNSAKLFEEFLDRYPESKYAPDVEEYIISGYIGNNDFQGALASIDRIAHKSDNLKSARQKVLFMLGTREYSDNNFTSALNRFAQAGSLTKAPYSPEVASQANLWHGLTLYNLERYGQSADELKKWIASAPNRDSSRPLALYTLGYAQFEDEKWADAAESFSQVISSQGSTGSSKTMIVDAATRYADCLYYQSQFGDAREAYAQAYNLNTTAGDYPLFQEGVMMGYERDYNGKQLAMTRFIELFPDSPLASDALLELAECQVTLNNIDQAISTYSQLVESYPATAAARKGRLQMAITAMDAGRTDEAVANYRKLIADHPTSDEARLAADDLKRYYARTGGLEEFASWMTNIVNAPAIDPSEIDNLTFSAAEKEYADTEKTEKLKEYLARFPKGNNEARALYLLAEDASLSNNNEDAYLYASRLIEEYPDAEGFEDAMLMIADAQMSQGKTEAALHTFDELQRKTVSPVYLSEARLGLLRTASALGRNATAIDAADKLLSTTSSSRENSSEILCLKAQALDRIGQHDEAYDLWKSIIKESPNDIFASQSAVQLSESLLANGNTEEAHTTIEKFINSNPSHQYWLARGFIVLSDVLRANNDDFEADQYLHSLRNNYPGNEADIFRMIDERLSKN